MPLTIKNKFGIGEWVYLLHDEDQYKRLIVFIQVNPNGLLYGLQCAESVTTHFELELTSEKQIFEDREKD